MKNIKSTNLRLNMDVDIQRQAWDYLQSMDKKIFKSYSSVIATALVEYFDRYYHLEEDPFFITKEREEEFSERIISAVKKELSETLPTFLSGCVAGIVQTARIIPSENIPLLTIQETETVQNTENQMVPEQDIDWDFLGS